MAYKDNISRLSRLTAILLKLQTRPFVEVNSLAKQFEVSKRTIYRDLESLEQSGVPITSEDSRGYRLIPGYNIPPVMFTEAEANAIIMAEKMMAQTKDASLIADLVSATDKIKSVLKEGPKEKAEFLSKRTIIGKNWKNEVSSSNLTDIQKALTNFQVLKISYRKESDEAASERAIEPFAIYHNTFENWILIAWCRLRKEFRNFRLDRMESIEVLPEQFEPHKMSMAEYVEIQRKKHFKE